MVRGMEPIDALDDGPVEEFMKYYMDDGYLAYEKLWDYATKILVCELDKLEIKHEIFDRGKQGSASAKAKAPASVRNAILRRQNGRGQKYKWMHEILSDMHDLAGTRIALYYPNDFEKVENIIKSKFVEVKPPQDWPDQHHGPFRYPTLDGSSSGQTEISGRKSRFPGYFARHFRVKLKDCDASESAVKGKTLEIQLMSLLMHAWSKMHHELIYKPRPGFPKADEDDERLLDISSGIIIAGEQVLRQIQINLDRKKELGRLPFKNEHDAWSYLNQKWACDRDNALSESQRSWILETGDSALEGSHKHLLYKSLKRLGFDNPEKFDLLVNHCLDSYGKRLKYMDHGDSAALRGVRGANISFIDMMIISVFDQDEYKALELEELQVLRPDIKKLTRSEAARLARYHALIVCNSLKWYGPNSLDVVWKCRGDFSGPYPSGREVLKILHPENPVEDKPGTIAKLGDFFNYLLDWDNVTWKLHCALSRLCYFNTETLDRETAVEGNLNHELAITACPWGFVQLLDHAAKNEDATLRQSFTLLEAYERYNSADVLYSQHNPFLPRRFRNYRCPSVTYRPRPTTDGKAGRWVERVVEKPPVPVELELSVVRAYLDHADSM